MSIGRAIWNIGGAVAASVASIAGAYWLVKLLDPLMAGDWGRLGAGIVVVTFLTTFVVLFVALLKLVPLWVAVGERRFD